MMKKLLACAALSLFVAAPAFAQSTGTTAGSSASTSAAPSSSASGSSASQNNPTAQKIKTDLQNAGFTNVNVVAEAFAVTAKSKDGHEVYMTFGPTGASMVETMGNAANGSASSSGSQNHASTGSSSATTK